MKLNEIYNDEFDAMNDRSDANADSFYDRRERDHILDLVGDYLETHNFKLKVSRAIQNLEDEQFEELKEMLYDVAMDNYDYATDTGSSIHIPEETIIQALRQLGAL